MFSTSLYENVCSSWRLRILFVINFFYNKFDTLRNVRIMRDYLIHTVYYLCATSSRIGFFFYLNNIISEIFYALQRELGILKHSTWLNVNQNLLFLKYWFIVHKVLNTVQTGCLGETVSVHNSVVINHS